MAQIVWTAEAQRWLEDIFGYIAGDNPVAAAETVQGIYDRAQVLEDFPEIGQRYFASERNVRILLYGHFRIVYLLKPGGNGLLQLRPRLCQRLHGGCVALLPLLCLGLRGLLLLLYLLLRLPGLG